LGNRAKQELLVVERDTNEGLRQAIAMQRPAVLLLSPEDAAPELLQEARANSIAVLGPASLGVGSPHQNQRFLGAPTPIRRGKVAFLTQSAELGAAILDWAQTQKVGLSAFVSFGKSASISLGEAIDYLAEDPYTKSILIYLESVGDAGAFLSAARECALSKPVIVLRAGRQDRQQDAVYDAAFRRCGVLRVQRLSDLFYLAEVLDRQPRPEGSRLALLTNAAGPGGLAADALSLAGSEASEFVNLAPGSEPATYGREFAQLLGSANNDAVLTILAPQPGLEPMAVAEQIAAAATGSRKPVFSSFLGGASVRAANTMLAESGVATFPYPDTAVRAFQSLWQYTSSLKALYETPVFAAEMIDASGIDRELREVRARGKESVEAPMLAKLLEAYGIPLEFREAKVAQPLRLRSEIAASFGPVLYLSAAGFGEEYYGDLAAALPPLTSTLARRFVERLRIHQAFRDATLRSLEIVLVRFSRLVTELPILRQVEIFPLCAENGSAWAGGVRATLQPRELAESLWPQCVIRPYPSQYAAEVTLRDGQSALMRPIRPEDERMIAEFHGDLSERSVYLRYLQFLKLEERIVHERLARVCFNDYSRELAFVVEQNGKILGVGRFKRNPLRRGEAEVACLVRDSEQGKGIGGLLLQHLIAAAKAEGLARLTAELLADNTPMRRILDKFGFQHRLAFDGQTLLASLELV
jgi:acetyltransferase